MAGNAVMRLSWSIPTEGLSLNEEARKFLKYDLQDAVDAVFAARGPYQPDHYLLEVEVQQARQDVD